MKILNPDNFYNSAKYYSGLRAGNMIFVAGRIPVDKEGNVYAPGDPGAQTERIMEDIQRILAEGDATLQDVVYIHTYYLNEKDFPAIHEARMKYMGDHKPPHTGSKNESASWVERGICLEIEVIAVLED